MGDHTELSRRHVLKVLGAGGVTGIAGCGERQNSQTPTETRSPTQSNRATTTPKDTVVFTDDTTATPVGTVTSPNTSTPSSEDTVVFDGGDAEAFENALQTAADNPGATLEIKEGSYRLAPAKAFNRPTPPHFRVQDMKDVTIEGNDATLVFSDPTHAGIDFFTSSDITIRNLSLDYDPVPFTQGTIRELNTNEKQLTIELDPGFPSLDHRMFEIASNVWASVHTSDGEFVRGTRQLGDPDKHFSAINKLSSRRFSLTLSEHSDMLGLASGRKLVIVARDFGHGLKFYEVDQPLVENVRVRASRAVGFNFQVCTRPIVRDCVLSPPPQSNRLICNNAGGVRFINCISEPTITGSRLEYQEDDGIMVQHTFSRVNEILDKDTIRTENIHPFVAQVGDPFTAISPSGVRKGPLPAVSDLEVRQKVGADTRPKPKTLTFESPIDDTLSVGDFVGNLATASHDFTIKNNEVRNTRVHLIRVTASHGIVEDNILEGARRNAIELECDTNTVAFAPKGWASDVVVQNNQITRPGLNNFAGEWPAGIRVHHENPPDTPTQGQPNRNITITGNTITNGAYCGIMLEDARNLQVKNNNLSSLNRLDYPGVGDAGFILQNVDNVTIAKNTVSGKADEVQYFGIERESDNIQSTNNQFQVSGTSESADLISLGRLRLSFNRAVKTNTGRYLSFLCRDLALLDAQDNVIVSVDVGADESGVAFGAGVDSPEQNANGDWRWFGSRTETTILFFAKSHLEEASKLRLRGAPFEEGITATVYVGNEKGETIRFGERRTRTFIMSLG